MAKFIIAVTGGIASGKSIVTELFSRYGIIIVDADIAARAIVEPGQPALEEITRTFGPHLVVNGHLDRPALRTLVFEDAESKKKLEAITHPRIRQLLTDECASAISNYTIVAIPLLAETGRAHYPWVNRTLVIDAPRSIQLLRLLSRDGVTKALADKMLNAQATRHERLSIADDVISNDSDLATVIHSVERLDARYRAMVVGDAARD